MTPFEIGIIFGAMAGWAAFFYLIYKSKMDKPKLELKRIFLINSSYQMLIKKSNTRMYDFQKLSNYEIKM